MDRSRLRRIMADHQEWLERTEDDLVQRDVDLDYALRGNEIVIITGIRRCGKSTLLNMISKRLPGNKIFLNFDDIRLNDLTTDNLSDVEDIAYEFHGTGEITYFLDEIQNVPGWERWVNNLHARGRKVLLTGSNSKLLSSEISTFLTGRNKVVRLYSFSFREYLRLKRCDDPEPHSTSGRNRIYRHFLEYFELGGFPVICRNDDVRLSGQYFSDIVNRDVLARYRVQHVKELKDMILFLFSNTGVTYSYSTLKRITGIRSLSTLKNYVDHLKSVFLLSTVDRFDYSLARQKISSAKPYIADASFFRTVAFNFSENRGKRLENLVFLELQRRGKEIYYHRGRKECDFLVRDGLRITSAIQVAWELADPATLDREVEGLKEAMREYRLDTGLILTLETTGRIEEHGITILPVWEWLLGRDG